MTFILDLLNLITPKEWGESCSVSFPRPLTRDDRDLNPSTEDSLFCYAAHASMGLDRIIGRGLGFINNTPFRLWTGRDYPYGIDSADQRTQTTIRNFYESIDRFTNTYRTEHTNTNTQTDLDYRRALARHIHDWIKTDPQGFQMRESRDAATFNMPTLRELFQTPRGLCFDYLKVFRFFYRLAGFQAEFIQVLSDSNGRTLGEEGLDRHVATRVSISDTETILIDQNGYDVHYGDVELYSDVRALAADFHQRANSLANTTAYEERIAHISRAILLSPGDPHLYARRADLLKLRLVNSDTPQTVFDDAIVDIERSHHLKLSESEYHALRGMLFHSFALKKTGAERTRLLRAALSEKQQAMLGSHNVTIDRHSLAKTHIRLGELDQANTLLNQTFEEARSTELPILIKKDLASTYNQLGRAYFDQHNYEQAAFCFKRAYQMQGSVGLIESLANISRAMENNSTVDIDNRSMGSSQNDEETYYCDYINALVSGGHIDEAKRDFASRNTPFTLDILHYNDIHLSRIHMIFGFGERTRGNLVVAENEFRQAIRYASLDIILTQQTGSAAEMRRNEMTTQERNEFLEARGNARAELIDVLIRESKLAQARAEFANLESSHPNHQQLTNLRARLNQQ